MRVLIVDDQWVILERLKERVAWTQLGIEEVILANSVAQAKKMFLENDIDFVITDIEMPIEDGMVLASWLKTNYPTIPCIFLTAFADFNYAQQAVKYGGFDYILQPAKTEDIERVVKKCIDNIIKNRGLLELVKKGYEYDDMHERVLEGLVKAMYSDDHKLNTVEQDWQEAINKKKIYKWYFPVIIDAKTENDIKVEWRLSQKLTSIDLCIGTTIKKIGAYTSYGFVICGSEEEWELEKTKGFFHELYMDFTVGDECSVIIYVGKTVTKDLIPVVQSLKKNQEDNVLQKEGVFWLRKKKVELKLKQPNIEVWKKWMLEGSGELIKNQIQNLLVYAENENQLTIEYMKQLFDNFLEMWIICCYSKKIDGKDFFETPQLYDEFKYAFRTMDSFNKAVKFIIDHFNEFLKNESITQENLDLPTRIQKVKQYVEENLDKNILRADTASLIFLSEDYFSKVFKSETGYGFKEYVLLQKMNYSKQLLKETSFPIGVIAGKVGYDNFSNFTQIFKKCTGKTPQEYRGEK